MLGEQRRRKRGLKPREKREVARQEGRKRQAGSWWQVGGWKRLWRPQEGERLHRQKTRPPSKRGGEKGIDPGTVSATQTHKYTRGESGKGSFFFSFLEGSFEKKNLKGWGNVY